MNPLASDRISIFVSPPNERFSFTKRRVMRSPVRKYERETGKLKDNDDRDEVLRRITPSELLNSYKPQ